MSTFTITPTYTVTPTPTIGSLSVVAAPNISRGGLPVQFQIALPKAAQVRLSLFTFMVEQVYQTTFQGNTGPNTLLWDVKNKIGQEVASGFKLQLQRVTWI